MEKNLKAFVPQFVSPKRSKIMSKIKSTGNKSTEVRFRMLLVRSGIKGWQMHRKDLPGNPDFYFPKKKIVIFIDGCFWHGCPRCYKGTKSNVLFWKTKVASNKKRDRKNNRYYRSLGFQVIRIWEHELREKNGRSLQILPK
ncbi:MAG: very short patch repair endonuclease [Bacteriovorax sp.]